MSASEIVGVLISVVISIILAWSQMQNTIPRQRSTLRADIEILKLLEPTDENYKIVKARVDSSIRYIYGARQREFRVYDWMAFILGLSFTAGFGWWTAHLISKGTWWAAATGFACIVGISMVRNAFERPRETKSSGAAEKPEDERGTVK